MTRSCHLFGLPQELQDLIFDYAYPRTLCWMNFISRVEWDTREWVAWRQDRTRYTCRPFPEPKVAKFVVFKSFFAAAARAWTGNQVLDEDVWIALNYHGSGVETNSSPAGGIVAAFAKTAIVNLRSLLLLIDRDVFACLGSGVAKSGGVLSDLQCEVALDFHTDLGKLRGLHGVRVIEPVDLEQGPRIPQETIDRFERALGRRALRRKWQR